MGNLDPKGQFSDEKIWSCVTTFGLLDFVQGLGRSNGGGAGEDGSQGCQGSLDTEIRPGGSSLSNGEKQLICCLRGLLYESRWVVLDESTSTLSTKFEDLMLSSFSRRFRSSTLLMVSHNIENVINYCDRVLVLDHGAVLELDTPANLLKDTSSAFH